MKTTTDILIIGGGIIGLTLARELVLQGHTGITIIEKEPELGKHASGRNSGVLHAGIYYDPDSAKAKFCLKGNRLLRRYCYEKGLPVLESKKVIVAQNERELPILQELHKRAVANGAQVELIDEKRLEEFEPNAKTCHQALLSYDTVVVDPKQVLSALQKELLDTGKVQILFNCLFRGIKKNSIIETSQGEIQYGFLINAAGAYSDKVAQSFGLAQNLRMVPFKGIYKKLKKEKAYLVNGNIYPVPDIRNPFLGVHFTRNVHGEVYLGPTAIPALGRENYGILEGIDREGFQILYRDAVLFCTNPKFREVALTEPRKYIHSYFYNNAKKLVKKLELNDIESTSKSGIRAQLVDWDKKELVMDFMVLKEKNSLHLLNPISPAFTSSMEIAKTVVKDYFS
ncbi:MAG: L-2-hydroxyglutarate oxidase [bacterium]|nr:L-2-hydroxyglutarate oxidase [bacterium]